MRKMKKIMIKVEQKVINPKNKKQKFKLKI